MREDVAGAQPATAQDLENETRVLVVDDHQDAAETIAKVLRLDGFTVAAAFDGPSALAEAERFQPQVVLLDIGMPGMDGYVVARELRARERTKSAIIIALTGYGQPEDRTRRGCWFHGSSHETLHSRPAFDCVEAASGRLKIHPQKKEIPMMKGFRQFLLRGNVLDLAVAVVIGAAFGAVVTALVKDLITPLIAAIVGKPDFSAIAFEINGSKFLIGDFINALLSFVLIAAAVYFFIVLPMNAFMARMRRGEAPPDPTTKKCPECLSEVAIAARRCAFCTSPLGTR